MDIGKYLDEQIEKLSTSTLKQQIAFMDTLLKTGFSPRRDVVALKNRYLNHLKKREAKRY